ASLPGLASTSAACAKVFSYKNQQRTRPEDQEQTHPTTPRTPRLPSITRPRFSHIPFRSPLLGESLLFTLPAGTEMFLFPASPPTALYIQTAATRHDSG